MQYNKECYGRVAKQMLVQLRGTIILKICAVTCKSRWECLSYAVAILGFGIFAVVLTQLRITKVPELFV